MNSDGAVERVVAAALNWRAWRDQRGREYADACVELEDAVNAVARASGQVRTTNPATAERLAAER